MKFLISLLEWMFTKHTVSMHFGNLGSKGHSGVRYGMSKQHFNNGGIQYSISHVELVFLVNLDCATELF